MNENERFELQNVAIPLKWQLPLQNSTKCQGNGQNNISKQKTGKKQFPKQFRTLFPKQCPKQCPKNAQNDLIWI